MVLLTEGQQDGQIDQWGQLIGRVEVQGRSHWQDEISAFRFELVYARFSGEPSARQPGLNRR